MFKNEIKSRKSTNSLAFALAVVALVGKLTHKSGASEHQRTTGAPAGAR